MSSQGCGEVAEQLVSLDEPFGFASGAILPRLQIAYETYGELDAQRTNAILVCHALSGHHHAAGVRDSAPEPIGWWDNMIGPGKPIDTNRFFVVSSNNIGGCNGSSGPSSLNPETGKPYGRDFPQTRVEDWVEGQRLLADHLGIKRFAAVVGGSIGGMQALLWALRHPERVGAAVVIACPPRLTSQNIAFNEIARQAIIRDPNYAAGDYYDDEPPRRGLAVARMLGHVTYLSDADMERKFGRAQRSSGDGTGKIFQVESYLRHQGNKFSDRFDANTYLLMTRALDAFDPAADAGGDLIAALAPASAQFLVVSFEHDWRFPPERCRELVASLVAAGKLVSYAQLDAPGGHDAFLMDDPHYHAAVRGFLQRQVPA
ncbi:MAG: homoserine O-acetyltransferase [Betaproteobacteria bacterium]|nr:homoserine O-acetyltransferase [Betaproteobacteria bacterium]